MCKLFITICSLIYIRLIFWQFKLNTLYFVRHGQTDWNKAFRWQGSSDNPLNQTGLEQADAIADYFVAQGVQVDAVISSPLKRAMTTGGVIAGALGLELMVEPQFHELSLGDFEGKTTDELKAEYAEVFDQWLGRYHLDPAPGGESLEQGMQRMAPALKLYMRRFNQPIIIVAHQAILSAMKAVLSSKMDVATLAGYKQANYEVDVWDVENACLQTRIDIRD